LGGFGDEGGEFFIAGGEMAGGLGEIEGERHDGIAKF
jgi:hypothetical protein